MLIIAKFFLSALMIVLISEVTKRSGALGGLVASLPLTSLLAIIWIFLETKDTGLIANHATSTLWYVLPSLVFFIVFPLMLTKGLHFWLSFFLSIMITMGAYALFFLVAKRIGLQV